MLKDCLEIFEKELKRVGERTGNPDQLVLDNYIPSDGLYLIIGRDGKIQSQAEIKMNKKTRRIENEPLNYARICFLDYYSQLVSMDKPQDPKKVIHSNNYLSFWVKQESFQNGKLNEEAIERYYHVLENPREKYTKPKDREMYDYIAQKVGEVDQEKLLRNKRWILEHIFSLEDLGVKLSGKGYLKIFFEDDDNVYIRENNRYLVTKIFNKNDYNIKIDGEIFGLPNDNMGMNSKKPFLEHKSRKLIIPYLISSNEALLQKKFFDYLMSKAAAGKTNVFFDSESGKILPCGKDDMIKQNFTGFFLQIKKGKELEIHHQDSVVDYRFRLKKKFSYQNILQTPDPDENYKDYRNVGELQGMLNEVLFSNWLVSNYFTPADELAVEGEIARNLMFARESIFAWLYKGKEDQIAAVLDQVCKNLMLHWIKNNSVSKAQKQWNLKISLKEYFGGEKKMGVLYQEITEKLRNKIRQKGNSAIESDEEYYFAAGQLLRYFISLNKAKDKMHSLANPFFNLKSDERLKEKLLEFFMKYNYRIQENGSRFNNLYYLVFNYRPEGKMRQDIMVAGYIADNLIYESNKEESENE